MIQDGKRDTATYYLTFLLAPRDIILYAYAE